MFKQEYGLVCTAAKKKVKFYDVDKAGYFVSSMLAGIFVGLGIIVIYVIAAAMGGSPSLKILQGASFAAVLSLIVFAGAELFTGNVFVQTAGFMRKTVKFSDAVPIIVFCYIGNFVGSILIVTLFIGTGLFTSEMSALTDYAIISKTSPSFANLFIRGILCNILVCSATWCTYKIQSDTGKLVMIFWCIYIFVISGFEHSIANMSLFTLRALVWSDGGATMGAMAHNLAATSLGNFVGGVMLALTYWAMGRKDQG